MEKRKRSKKEKTIEGRRKKHEGKENKDTKEENGEGTKVGRQQ